MGVVCKNAIGHEIILEANYDISSATEIKIRYKKPSGLTGAWIGILVETNKAKYVTKLNDLSESGKWELQLYVKLATYKGCNEIEIMEVLPIIEYISGE